MIMAARKPTSRQWARMAGLVIMAVASTRLAAQEACRISDRTDAPADGSWASPLDRRITIRVAGLTLRDALERVAAQARIRLSYSAELVPVDRRVCIDQQSAPVGRILDALLAPSDLQAVALGGDQVVVGRRAVPGDPALDVVDSAVRVQTLVPVIVTARQAAALHGRDATAAIVRLEGADLGRGDPRTLAQILETYVPGALGWSAGGSAVASHRVGLRGASSFGTSAPKVYIDGIEVANPSLATILDPEVIERIEIIRGPQGAALYGSGALNGVLSITTRHGGAEAQGIDLALRSAGGMVESRYASSPSFTQSHSLTLRAGSLPRSMAISVTGDESGSYLPGTGSRQLAGVVTARLAGERGSIGMIGRLAGVNALSRLSLPSLAPPTAPAVDGPASESLQQYTLGVSARLQPRNGWAHSIVAGLDGYRLAMPREATLVGPVSTDWLIDQLPLAAARASLRASSVGQVALTDATSATFTLGAEYNVLRETTMPPFAAIVEAPDSETMRSAATRSDTRGSSGPRQAFRTLASARRIESSRSGAGLLSQLDLAFHETLYLTGGVRLERTSWSDATLPVIAALPMVGAAAVAQWGDLGVKLRGSYGKGMRAPRLPSIGQAARGTYTTDRVTMMMPEEQAGFEVGVDLFAGRSFSLQVTRFDQLASGLQQPVTAMLRSGAVVHHFRSVGEIENRGWEVQPAIALGGLTISGALSVVDSRVRAVAAQYDGDLRPGDRMLGVPALTAALSLSYERERTAVSIGLSHARDWIAYDVLALEAGLEEGAAAPESLRDYWREYSGASQLRASLSRDLKRGVTLLLSGENLLDQPWGALDNGTPVAGRTTTAGLRVRF